MNSVIPTVNTQEAGESLWFGGGLDTFKVTSEQSGGVLCLIEHAASRGKRTPLHLHPDHDEMAYVLEGELLLHIDGVEHTAGPGAVVWIPRGTPHAYLVTSKLERSLWVVTPGGAMEAFYRQAGDVALSRTPPPAEINIARLRAVGRPDRRAGASLDRGDAAGGICGARSPRIIKRRKCSHSSPNAIAVTRS